MVTRLRFAPSPTGLIHVGNLRTALFNWLFAMRSSGDFLLRFDDTDAERSRSSYAEAIIEDLEWVGIRPQEIFRQSERIGLYEAAAEKLKATGRLYPCFETPEELERKRTRQRRRGAPPVYDRSALDLTDDERAELGASGRKPHWRFLLGDRDRPAERIEWEDIFRGRQEVDLASASDPILIREDGTFLYTLPSVVDDIDKSVSHIVRGEDHNTNTAVQIDLFDALGAALPIFGHHNLLTAPSGEGLSKRTGSQSISSLRSEGYEAMAVATLAALTGTSSPVEPTPTMDGLASSFASANVSRAPARFDVAELDSLNARLLHQTSYSDVVERLAEMGVNGGEDFWIAIRANCTRLADAVKWWRCVAGPVAADPGLAGEDAFLAAAAASLPNEPWDEATFGVWTDAVKEATGRRGRTLFKPLRLALTGLDHGPELALLLPLIGRSNTLDRLGASPHR